MNLADLDEARRGRVLAGARPMTLARNAAAYGPGDPADRLYFVRTGRMKIVRANAAGAEAIVGIRTAGDIFGELTWLRERGPRIRSTSAVAIETSLIAGVEALDFGVMIATDAEIARCFVRGLTRRLTTAQRELTELAGKSVPGRLVDVLGRLAAEHGTQEPDGSVRIGLHLTHQDLADLIGTSRETLTRELSILADVGLLRVAHKTVSLVQPKAFPYARRREPS